MIKRRYRHKKQTQNRVIPTATGLLFISLAMLWLDG